MAVVHFYTVQAWMDMAELLPKLPRGSETLKGPYSHVFTVHQWCIVFIQAEHCSHQFQSAVYALPSEAHWHISCSGIS